MRVFLIALGVVSVGFAQATDLTFTGVADDTFTAYVTTNDTAQGTQFVSQVGSWQSGGATGSIALTAGVTNYLHIIAADIFGAPSMLIGQASLNDALFSFGNGTQSILTNTTDWNVSLTGFGTNYVTPTDLGQNGTGPWQTQNNVNINARRIWSSQTSGNQYFSIAINPVPEPMTLVAIGALGTLVLRRKR